MRVLLEHTTKDGSPRIKVKCAYPLTAERCVSRIYTNLAVIDVTPEGLIAREIVDGMSFEELQQKTEAPLTLANDWCPLVAKPATPPAH